jgi:hypothetical protein
VAFKRAVIGFGILLSPLLYIVFIGGLKSQVGPSPFSQEFYDARATRVALEAAQDAIQDGSPARTPGILERNAIAAGTATALAPTVEVPTARPGEYVPGMMMTPHPGWSVVPTGEAVWPLPARTPTGVP